MECRGRLWRILTISCLAATVGVWLLLADHYQNTRPDDLTASREAEEREEAALAELMRDAVLVDPDLCKCKLDMKGTAPGGWLYDEKVIAGSHVRFDDGLGSEILRVVRTKSFIKKGVYSLLDLGAGVGQFGRWLKDKGVSDIAWTGYDGGSNIQEFCNKSVKLIDQDNYTVPNVCYLDASLPINARDLGAPFDWVISIEVGEHIPAPGAHTFIENLSKLTVNGVVLSWAVQGQGGRFHVNERNNTAVVQAFEKLGLFYDPDESMHLRAQVDRLGWLRNTVMLFLKKPSQTIS